MRSELWIYPGQVGNWHFVTLPKKQSDEIKKKFGEEARGWGSLPVSVTIGKTKWKTSVFPDKREDAYLLPIKSHVRKKEGLREGKQINFSIEILV